MGLYIVAYEHARPVIPCDQDLEEDDEHIVAWVDEDMARSLRGLQMGCCYETSGNVIEFHAGTYGGYNKWRDELARRAVGLPAATVWEDPSRFVEAPFFELINFSDCEGTIWPDAASDLATDFGALRDRIAGQPLADPQEEAWFIDVYDQFQEAFELAARGGGLVLFC